MNPNPPTQPGTEPTAVNGHQVHRPRGRLAVVREPGTGTDPGPAVPVPDDTPDWPPPDPTETGPASGRRIRFTPASSIRLRPTYWLWDQRIPHGMFALGPGREGIGKSLFCAWLAAQVTHGRLPGVHYGQPRSVLYAATEDSWEHTIAGRLLVAGADMDRVYRIDVESPTGLPLPLTLPRDCAELAQEIPRAEVSLLVLDPLISAVDARIDTNGADQKLREALEPLAALADRAGCAVFGLAHFNKSSGTDVLSRITGSRAFAAVARAVIAFARDTTADDGTCVISQVKSNLGPLDLPSLRYRVTSVTLPTEEGPGQWGRLDMLGETDTHVNDLLEDTPADQSERRAQRKAQRDELAAWVREFLTERGGSALSDDVYTAALEVNETYTKHRLKRVKDAVPAYADKQGQDWWWVLGPGKGASAQGSKGGEDA